MILVSSLGVLAVYFIWMWTLLPILDLKISLPLWDELLIRYELATGKKVTELGASISDEKFRHSFGDWLCKEHSPDRFSNRFSDFIGSTVDIFSSIITLICVIITVFLVYLNLETGS